METQASDLVRLRRALVSAQAIAAQRLQVISDVANARAHRARREEGKVFEWVRSIVLGEIARIQDAIADVIKWSRWRRMGHRLRLAKRLDWENGDWRTDLNEAPTVATAITGTHREVPSIPELLNELDRLNKLLDHIRLSRWRKFGHWLGLAKRLAWEAGEWRDPLLISPFPSQEAETIPNADPSARTSRSSYGGFVEYANERFLEECHSFATDVILMSEQIPDNLRKACEKVDIMVISSASSRFQKPTQRWLRQLSRIRCGMLRNAAPSVLAMVGQR